MHLDRLQHSTVGWSTDQSVYEPLTQGAITHQTLLEVLERGEVLNDIDIEAEIEAIEATKLAV